MAMSSMALELRRRHQLARRGRYRARRRKCRENDKPGGQQARFRKLYIVTVKTIMTVGEASVPLWGEEPLPVKRSTSW